MLKLYLQLKILLIQHLITTNEVPDEDIQQLPDMADEANDVPLRRSQRERKSTISSDYVIYLSEDMDELMLNDDPTSFKEAMKSVNSSKWLDAMKDEMKNP